MLTVAITGNAGSGKTTICELFQNLGATIISTDEINRILLQSSGFLIKLLEQALDQTLSTDGKPDKDKIWKAIISSPDKRETIESVLHPVIMQNVNLQLDLCRSTYCLVEVPLLFEAGLENYFDRILLITASHSVLKNRLNNRDQAHRGNLIDILDTQMTDRIKFALSDDIIFNDGTLDVLDRQVSLLHQRYIKGNK
ncbi:MAG: dephospho-CoA kinase [Gammaproteobacteria bacterium]|nr:MAG: dephospho-CoA kinase [Gammaproteobacteria bacterium]